MTDKFILQNRGRGQIAFMLYPMTEMDMSRPKHKRRKDLREGAVSIVIPRSGSVDLVEKTGLSEDELTHHPEVMKILKSPNVMRLPNEREPEPVRAPEPPVVRVVEAVPEKVAEVVLEAPIPASEKFSVPESVLVQTLPEKIDVVPGTVTFVSVAPDSVEALPVPEVPVVVAPEPTPIAAALPEVPSLPEVPAGAPLPVDLSSIKAPRGRPRKHAIKTDAPVEE